MVGITHVHIYMIFAFYGYIDFFLLTQLDSLVGCLRMIVWTHAVLGVLYIYIYIYISFITTACQTRFNTFSSSVYRVNLTQN